MILYMFNTLFKKFMVHFFSETQNKGMISSHFLWGKEEGNKLNLEIFPQLFIYNKKNNSIPSI